MNCDYTLLNGLCLWNLFTLSLQAFIKILSVVAESVVAKNGEEIQED